VFIQYLETCVRPWCRHGAAYYQLIVVVINIIVTACIIIGENKRLWPKYLCQNCNQPSCREEGRMSWPWDALSASVQSLARCWFCCWCCWFCCCRRACKFISWRVGRGHDASRRRRNTCNDDAITTS